MAFQGSGQSAGAVLTPPERCGVQGVIAWQRACVSCGTVKSEQSDTCDASIGRDETKGLDVRPRSAPSSAHV